MKLSERLELRREKHDTLGETFVLFSPMDEDGSAAYYVDYATETVETGVIDESSGTKEVVEEMTAELGMGLRLTRETATKLAWQLLAAVGAI